MDEERKGKQTPREREKGRGGKLHTVCYFFREGEYTITKNDIILECASAVII